MFLAFYSPTVWYTFSQRQKTPTSPRMASGTLGTLLGRNGWLSMVFFPGFVSAVVGNSGGYGARLVTHSVAV